jgi:hypothetical protein
MDPRANKLEQLELASGILRCVDNGIPPYAEDSSRLAELVITLAECEAKGGFKK